MFSIDFFTINEPYLIPLKSRRGFNRKLWRFNSLNTSSTAGGGPVATLIYSDIESVRAEKEINFACNCANTLDSQMLIIHKIKSLYKKKRKYLKLWSQGFIYLRF